MTPQTRKLALGVIVPLCIGQISTMTGIFAFPALLPQFMDLWGLSNAQAGWIGGIIFAGYALVAPVLVSLTDRVDSRKVYLGAALLGLFAHIGFIYFAEGFWSAFFLRLLVGVSLAGTYVPGLRMMVDRLPETTRPRAVPFYTSAFSLGSAFSFLVAGQLGGMLGWQAAFWASAAGMLAGLLIALKQPPQEPQQPEGPKTGLLDFRPIFKNRAAMGFILAYAAHCWELFTFRSWIVAFLTASAALTGYQISSTTSLLTPSAVATMAAIVAMASSLLGAEWATRKGRAKWCRRYMFITAAVAAGFGFGLDLNYPVVVVLALVYSAVIQLDSAALTTGAVETAEEGRRGATLAVHSFLGFMAGFAGPLVMGVILDGLGTTPVGWGIAFAMLAAIGLFGSLALRQKNKTNLL